VLEPPPGLGVGDPALARVRALGARIDVVSRSRVRISASPAVLARVAELAEIGALRFPLVPVPVAGSGAIVSSRSVWSARPPCRRTASPASTSTSRSSTPASSAAAARGAGEIPANAINVDLSGGGMETITAHGTAVAGRSPTPRPARAST
jgi:hypothetical protein